MTNNDSNFNEADRFIHQRSDKIIPEKLHRNQCGSCGARENKSHPLRGINVVLEEVEMGENKVKFCQICATRNKVIKSMKNNKKVEKLMKYFYPKY